MSNRSAPGDLAPPLWFGTITKVSTGNLTPDPAGTSLAFMMAEVVPPNPALQQGWVGFWAYVTNNTDYDLRFGFVQTADLAAYRSYTDGTSRGINGQGLLDYSSDLMHGYLYQDYSISVGKGANAYIPIYTANLCVDSPSVLAKASNGTGFLQTLTWDIQLHTHLVVDGGWRPTNGPGVAGYPIALSTADWHLKGQAINTFNSANPGAANTATTTNMANWSVALHIGAGPSPASISGTAGSVPWISTGDGVAKFLQWDGNTEQVSAPWNISSIAAWAGHPIRTEKAVRFGQRSARPNGVRQPSRSRWRSHGRPVLTSDPNSATPKFAPMSAMRGWRSVRVAARTPGAVRSMPPA